MCNVCVLCVRIVLSKTDQRWLIIFLTFIVAVVAGSRTAGTTANRALTPAFASDNPQSIYAADPNDPWNRIFQALVNRTVEARISVAFLKAHLSSGFACLWDLSVYP